MKHSFFRLKNGNIINYDDISCIKCGEYDAKERQSLGIVVHMMSGTTLTINDDEYNYLINMIQKHESYMGW